MVRFCTYCIRFPERATQSCLLCEAYLCAAHLRVHSRSPEHVLSDVYTSMEKRKCSVHKEPLKFYCTDDNACVCVSCRLDGEHRGHQVETLEEASEKKKKELKDVLAKLMTKREEAEERVQSLQEHGRKVQGKADDETERVTALFRDLKRCLEDLERRALREISGEAERVSISILDIIRELEIKKEGLSQKMGDIEELCNMTDPLTVLQESETGDLCDTEDGDNEDRERRDKLLHDGGDLDLDVGGISRTLHTGLSDVIMWINAGIHIQNPADILLDINTASNNLQISDDPKTASKTDIIQNRRETWERFDYYQVMSREKFSSGRHYWVVDGSGSNNWLAGMCYPSIERKKGGESTIGWNSKSWALHRHNDQYSFKHNTKVVQFPVNFTTSNRVKIDLDYEAGRISFYDLCYPPRLLHTFYTTFTEPLHAALNPGFGSLKICGWGRDPEKPVQRLVTS